MLPTSFTTSAIRAPLNLLHYIEVLEQCLGRKAEMSLLPLFSPATCWTPTPTEALVRDTDRPATTVEEGVARFVEWYRDYTADWKAA